jgi:hypothetical protein
VEVKHHAVNGLLDVLREGEGNPCSLLARWGSGRSSGRRWMGFAALARRPPHRAVLRAAGGGAPNGAQGGAREDACGRQEGDGSHEGDRFFGVRSF